MPAASFCSSEEAVEGFDSKTSFWGICFNKSAVVPAACLGSFQTCPFCSHECGRNKVHTGRAPYASVRLRTLGCHPVSQRLH
jgi:hypothetical protein